jgi:small subunit ribosomal protein S8
MSNHPVSDLVARINNGYMAKRAVISCPVSKLREEILKILKEEGYISNYSKFKEKNNFYRFDIHLKYHLSLPVVTEIEVVSKPGKKVYCKFDEIPVVKNGLGAVIMSTSSGLLADHEARVKKLGGEILLKIF